MRIIIVYDNTFFEKGLTSDWGFSCFIESKEEPNVLFDTGTKPNILLDNMKKLKISPDDIDEVFISHSHHDHTGGLKELLKLNRNIKVYIPASFKFLSDNSTISVKKPIKLHGNYYSTGELNNIEQSLIIKKEEGVTVISGCAHSKVENILNSAFQYGKIRYLIGGLHGFDKYELLEDVDYVCATHCTQNKRQIKKRYPNKWIEGGVGRVINI